MTATGKCNLPAIARRRLLTSAGTGLVAAGVAPGLFTPFISRAYAQNKTLSIVQWSHFVPAFDTWFDKFAHDWGSKNGITVTVDHIPEQDIAARAASKWRRDRGTTCSCGTVPAGRTFIGNIWWI